MPIKMGSANIGSIYLGSTKIRAAYLGNVKVYESVDPYNPLGLPAYTIRVRCASGVDPLAGYTGPVNPTEVQVSADPNIWDVTLASPDWSVLFGGKSIVEVLGANTTGVTNMSRMFEYCTSLTTLCLFDTSSVTSLYSAFRGASNITSIPLFPTGNLTDVGYAFAYCNMVESGALALYQQMSTQANPPSNHIDCFSYCGNGTASGRAELDQIPSSWGGTGA